MIRNIMFNTSSKSNTPNKLLELMHTSNVEFGTDFSISLFDQSGNSFTGFFESLDTNTNIVTLVDEYKNAIFFNIKFITLAVYLSLPW